MSLKRFSGLLVTMALCMVAVAAPAATSTKTYTVYDGYNRSYIVTRPASCVSSCPLVVDMHGFTGSAATQKKLTGLDANGAANGYIVVYPNGLRGSWNAGTDYGSCCGFAVDRDIDDVGFIREVVAQVTAAYPVDRQRVYASGFSNGCAMTQRIAVEASDVFAAAACSSLYLLKETTALARPFPFTEIHALNDKVIPYPHTPLWPGAVVNFTRWANLNQCTDAPSRTYLNLRSYVDVHAACAGGVAVKLFSLANSDHSTYDHSNGLDVAQILWDNLKDYRLP